jgi:hypothetical protein
LRSDGRGGKLAFVGKYNFEKKGLRLSIRFDTIGRLMLIGWYVGSLQVHNRLSQLD